MKIKSIIILLIMLMPLYVMAGENEKLLYSAVTGKFRGVINAIKNGADVNVKDRKNGLTPLIAASDFGNIGIVKHLILNGAHVNAKNKKGETALMAASIRGHLDLAKCLISNGADVSTKNKAGETALMMASAKRHLLTVKYLKSKNNK